MTIENMKCVFVISTDVSLGHALNCCALLAANFGSRHPELIGETPIDSNGIVHSGLCSLPITILKATSDEIKKIRMSLEIDTSVEHYDVTTISQKARKYSDVIEWTREAPFETLSYVGVGLVGAKSKVAEYTGKLELFR